MHEAQEVERKLVDKLEEADGKGNVFKVVKKMAQTNRDVVGDACIKDESGKVVVDQDECREVWRKYFEKLLTEEFAWDRAAWKMGIQLLGLLKKLRCMRSGQRLVR